MAGLSLCVLVRGHVLCYVIECKVMHLEKQIHVRSGQLGSPRAETTVTFMHLSIPRIPRGLFSRDL